jgi:hypothetical protein
MALQMSFGGNNAPKKKLISSDTIYDRKNGINDTIINNKYEEPGSSNKPKPKSNTNLPSNLTDVRKTITTPKKPNSNPPQTSEETIVKKGKIDDGGLPPLEPKKPKLDITFPELQLKKVPIPKEKKGEGWKVGTDEHRMQQSFKSNPIQVTKSVVKGGLNRLLGGNSREGEIVNRNRNKGAARVYSTNLVKGVSGGIQKEQEDHDYKIKGGVKDYKQK